MNPLNDGWTEITEEKAKKIVSFGCEFTRLTPERMGEAQAILDSGEGEIVAWEDLYREAKGFLAGVAAERKKRGEFICIKHDGYDSCPDCVKEYQQTEKLCEAADAELETLRKSLSDEIAKNEGLRKELDLVKELSDLRLRDLQGCQSDLWKAQRAAREGTK